MGPPQGQTFITPIATHTSIINALLSILSFLNNGSIAVIVMMNVVAPEPSRCPITATAAVAQSTAVTLVPAFLMRKFTTGSNTPWSLMSEKNEIENTNSDTVLTILLIPEAANLLIASGSNPAASAAIVGRSMNAIGGMTIFLMRQTMSTNTMMKPIIASLAEGAAAFLAAGFAGLSISVKVLYSSSIICWYSAGAANPGRSL